MKNNSAFLKLFFPFFLCIIGCTEIPKENKVAIIGKIIDRLVIAKNGQETVAYFYNGKQYLTTDSFNANYYTYNDMFILFIDKTNPHHHEIPINPTKVLNVYDFPKDTGLVYDLKEIDLEKIDSIR